MIRHQCDYCGEIGLAPDKIPHAPDCDSFAIASHPTHFIGPKDPSSLDRFWRGIEVLIEQAEDEGHVLTRPYTAKEIEAGGRREDFENIFGRSIFEYGKTERLKKAGRPSKLREVIICGLGDVEFLAASRATADDFATFFGITERAWRTWRRDAKIAIALAKGGRTAAATFAKAMSDKTALAFSCELRRARAKRGLAN